MVSSNIQTLALLLMASAARADFHTRPKNWPKETQDLVLSFVNGSNTEPNLARTAYGETVTIRDLYYEDTGAFSTLWPIAFGANVTLSSPIGWLLNAAVTRNGSGKVTINGIVSNLYQYNYVPPEIKTLTEDEWHNIILTQANEVEDKYIQDGLRWLMNNMAPIVQAIKLSDNFNDGQVISKPSVGDAGIGCYQYASPNIQDCQKMLARMSDNITSDVATNSYRYYYDSCAIVHSSNGPGQFNIERIAVNLFNDCSVSTVNNRLIEGWAGTAYQESNNETACLVHVGAAPYCVNITVDPSLHSGNDDNTTISGEALQSAIIDFSAADSRHVSTGLLGVMVVGAAIALI